jgi:type III pantothenate kinase
MILAVDVGNTQTVVGVFQRRGEADRLDAADRLEEADRLDGHWRMHTDASSTSDELGAKIGGLLALEKVGWDDIEHMIVSSVVPSLTDAYESLAERLVGEPPLIVGPGLKTGMPIEYDNPHEVGADRIVNGVAAFELYGGPVVVVDFGTATTIDVIDSKGAYLGGAIASGVETSAEALFSKAAKLMKVDLDPVSSAIGRNTRASLQSGLLLGQAVMVDGLVERAWEELQERTPVVATGGLAERMAPMCETVTDVDPDLTLRGLMMIWDRNTDR